MNPTPNSPEPTTDAQIGATSRTDAVQVFCKKQGWGNSIARLSEFEKLERELSALKLDFEKAKNALCHFVTHYEVADYSEETFNEIEKVAVSLWGIVKERDSLKSQLQAERERGEKIIEALFKYGRHYLECDEALGRGICSCGLDEALAAQPVSEVNSCKHVYQENSTVCTICGA